VAAPEPTGKLNARNVVAVLWDFDKTLTPGYMQKPIFERYGVDEATFWREVNALPALYHERGTHVSPDTIYLNHLLSYVKNGPMKGLNNAILRELGRDLALFPGLPAFLQELKEVVHSKREYRLHDITLEHYIVSTGLAEMIRGCPLAGHVDGIYGCEFVENPVPPGFLAQEELSMEGEEREIAQIGVMVDNTIKTRFVFEINKGSNVNPEIDVNASMAPADRRVPIANMIYVADGPSDVPVFSVVRRAGGKAYAVYEHGSAEEFAQNDGLLQKGRVDNYGPADYTENSSTAQWLRMHVLQICERIVREREEALKHRVSPPPRHLHKRPPIEPPQEKGPRQEELLGE